MKSFYSFRTALIISLGGFLFGFDASVISGAIGFVRTQFDLNDIQMGWVVSSPSFAAMFAMLIAGTLSDYIGRKKVLIFAALLYSVSAFFSALAPSYYVLVIARMIGGLGFGAALVVAPIYIAELAPAEKRGKLVSIQQLNIVLGFSISYFSNYFLLNAMENGSTLLTETTVWRWMLGIEFFPAIIYFILMFFVPRSPRWLYLKNRIGESEKILTKIYGSERTIKEKKIIEENLKQSTIKKSSGLSALFVRGMGFIMLIALIVGIIQQITGINAILFYAPTIFEQSGVGTNAAFAQAVLVGIIQLIFTIIAMNTIDRFGRKPLLLAGLAGVVISMLLTAYGFHKAEYTLTNESILNLTEVMDTSGLSPMVDKTYTSDVEFKNDLRDAIGTIDFNKNESAILEAAISINARLVLVGILIFIASFAISLGPVMWVILSEIFPGSIRGLAIAVIGLINSLVSFLVQLLFPWELNNLGNSITYSIFGFFAFIGFILILKYLPETKGKSLEQIESELIR